MSNLINKRSAVSGKIPLTTALTFGEIAVNTFDGNFFTKYNNGSGVAVAKFSNDLSLSITESQISNLKPYLVNISSQSITDLSDVLTTMTPANNEVLTFDTTNGWHSGAAGGGTLTEVGTPILNELAIWDGAAILKGDANITWDGTSLGVTGIIEAKAGGALHLYNTTNSAWATFIFNTSTSRVDANYPLNLTDTGISLSTAGKVGIGTVTPSNELDVLGSGLFSSSVFIGDANTKLTKGPSNSLDVATNSGYVQIGPQNTAWCHFYTDRSGFYFNKSITTVGSVSIGSYNVKDSSLSTLALAATSTSIYTFPLTTYSGGKFVINTTDTVTGERQITEFLITHNGTVPSWTEYGQIFTGSAALASFTVDISGTVVRILATDVSANSTTHKIAENLFVA